MLNIEKEKSEHGEHAHHPKTIEVTVLYVGNDDFRHHFPPTERIHEVKLHAMSRFGIEKEAADKYALQHKGADQPEREHLSKLHEHCVTLTLVLKKEVPKG